MCIYVYICIYYVDINTPNIVYKKHHILEKREGEREKEWKGVGLIQKSQNHQRI